MDLMLKGKRALVAASSKGIGFGIARELAREGASVVLGSRSRENVEHAARAIRDETGSRVEALSLDASHQESTVEWVRNGASLLGGVDLLVANAGGPPPGRFDDFGEREWRDAFELTLMSTVRMIREALPHMRSHGAGSILAVTSISVKEPIDTLLLSNVFRSGVTSLLKTLSLQLAPEGIRVNSLMPGRIDTDRVRSLDETMARARGITPEEQKTAVRSGIPLGRYGDIEEFGRTAAFLLSPAASYITGESWAVDGGLVRTAW